MGNFINLTGQIFGQLTVQERAIEKEKEFSSKKVIWKCLCSCGNIYFTRTGDLKAGTSYRCRSCASKVSNLKGKRNFIDETGNKYGRLTVLEIDKKNISGYQNTKWICQCDCGSIISIYGSNLRSGRQKSCGCIISKGEDLISSLLKENNIEFQKQFSFNDCLSPSGNKLRFDFAILSEENNLKYLIEYDGIQHFELVERFGGEKGFLKRQENDKVKNEYCLKNNIKLIRVSNIKEIISKNIIY